MCVNTDGRNGSSPDDSKTKAPIICQFWIDLHDALPSMHLFGLDVNLSVFSALSLTAVRFLAEYVMVTVFGWPEVNHTTKYAATCIAAMVHSLLLWPGLASFFWNHSYNPSESLTDNKSAPAWCEKTATSLLQFCTGYMLYDGILNLLWLTYNMKPEDFLAGESWLFMVHHIATVLYMTSTRILGAGHQSAMICMFLGEVTNPLHNSYFIAIEAQKLACCNGAFSQQLYRVIEFSFASLYFVTRGLIAPLPLVYTTYCLWWRRNSRIPYWILGIWTFLMWGIELGSIPYIQECWDTSLKYLPDSVSSVLSASSASAEL